MGETIQNSGGSDLTGEPTCAETDTGTHRAGSGRDAWRQFHDQLQTMMPPALASRVETVAFSPSGERRIVTILSWQVQLVAANGDVPDTEAVYIIGDRLIQAIGSVIYRYEGLIHYYDGAQLRAVFGLPSAHENDVARALRAALDLRAEMATLGRALKREFGMLVSFHAGVHTGPVIVSRGRSTDEERWHIVGETLRQTEVLRDLGPSGAILVSGEVRRLAAGSFHCVEVPTCASGDAEALATGTRAYALEGVRALVVERRGMDAGLVPMVGRVQALELLTSAWDAVRAGAGARVALITGEAGVGKTRLVSEFTVAAVGDTGQVHRGGCQTYTRQQPLYLISDLVHHMLGVKPTDTIAARRDALDATLEDLAISSSQWQPYLSGILGLPPIPDAPGERVGLLDDDTLQKMTHAALQGLVQSVAARQPVVLVLEDLHWADRSSLEALQHLLRSLGRAPVLVVLVSRDSSRASVGQPLLDAAVVLGQDPIDVRLEPLPREECEEFVSWLLPSVVGDDRGLRSLIVARSEGNPYFAEEIVRMLLERGNLQRSGGSYVVAADATDAVRGVPPTLAGLLLARMDGLTDPARRALQVSAVVGSQIQPTLVASLLGGALRDTQAHLTKLVSAGFLVRGERQPAAAPNAFSFRHALVQETVYRTLLGRDQRHLHGLVAHQIEAGQDTTSHAVTETLAYHYARSSEPERAAPYLLQAADAAARRCDYLGAIDRYRDALRADIAISLPQSDTLKAKIGLGRALKYTRQYGEATPLLESALRAALYESLRADVLETVVLGLRELADIRHMEGEAGEAYEFLASGLAAIEDQGQAQFPELWRSVMERMSWVRFREGRLDEAFDLASRATLNVDLDQENDPITLASLYNTLGGISWQKGDPSHATRYLGLSLQLYSRMHFPWGMANAYINLGVLHYTLGAWREAERELGRAEQLWRQIGDVHQRAVTLNNIGILQQALGDHKAAGKALQGSLALFSEIGEAWGRGRAHISLARLALARRDNRGAEHHAQSADEILQSVGHTEVELEWVKAAVLKGLGLSGAHQIAESALELARQRHQLDDEVQCLRLLGEICALEGLYLEAESLLRESADLCVHGEMPYGLGLALLQLGRLYALLADQQLDNRQQHLDRAREMVRQTIEQFEKLGAARDLREAQDLLAQLGDRPDSRQPTETMADELPERGDVETGSVVQVLPEGEVRPVSVVWISTAANEDALEESIFDALAELVSAVASVAKQYQGRVVQQQQGVMVVFGAMQALEDDTERAVQAAYELTAKIAQMDPATRSALRLGTGIAVGSAITGSIGSQFHTEFIVRGEPVDDARGLAVAAPTAEVWVTEAARQATERIATYETVASVAGARRLAGLRDDPVAARGVPGLRSRMIGREDILRSMLRLSGGLSSETGALIWVEGEPGIGKSRLMEEFGSAMAASGVKVWHGQCSPQSASRVFSLFADLLIQILSLRPSDPPDTVTDRLTALYASWPASIQSTRPYLEIVLGLWPAGLPGERLSKLEPEQLRQQTFVSLRRFIKQLAQQGPVVMLLDDLHWIDPISAELLSFLLTIVAREPIVFVCAQRRQGGDAPNDRLVRAQSLIPDLTLRVSLSRLSDQERRRLLDELLPDAEIPEAIINSILDRSDGNPYFIEEYLKALLDQGQLVRVDGRWQVRGDASLTEVSVPASLEALLRSRVDALPSELREVIQAATVVGAPFTVDVLQETLGGPDPTDALARLASRLLLRTRLPEGDWEFHHPMIADVIYSSMLDVRRRHLHHAVAQALEARHPEDSADHAELLAFHLTRAGRGVEALIYLVLAGERAAVRFANDAAIEHLEAAAVALSQSPTADDAVRWRLAAALGDVYRAMGRHDDAMSALRAGLALTQTGMLNTLMRAGLYRRLGETARKQGRYTEALKHYNVATLMLQGSAGNEERVELARTFLGIAWVRFHQGAIDESLVAVERCRTAAEETGAVAELSSAENLLGGVYYRSSQWGAAERHTRRAMVLREQMGYTWGVASTLSNIGVLAVLNGDWHKARSSFARSLKLRADMDDAEGLALLLNNLGNLSRDQGDLEEAESLFRQSLDTLKLFGHSFHFANAAVGLASVFCLRDEHERALTTLQPALRLAEEIGAADVLVDGQRWTVEILTREGSPTRALAVAAEALGRAKEHGGQAAMVTLLRLSSEAELTLGNVAQARAHLERAMEVIDEVADVLERGRVHLQAGRIAAAEGNWSRAEPSFQSAQRIFLQLEAKLDIERLREIVGEQRSG